MDTVKEAVVRGGYENCPGDTAMRYTARLDEILTGFADDLAKSGFDLMSQAKTEEIMNLMSDSRGVSLPNFHPNQPELLKSLLRKQLDRIAYKCERLVEETHRFAESVHMEVVKESFEGYPALLCGSQVAARNIIGQSREDCTQYVDKMLMKEELVVFTKNGLYMDIVQGVQAKLASTKNPSSATTPWPLAADTDDTLARLEREIGKVDLTEVSHGFVTPHYQTAWDMKLSLAAYWTVVRKRIADNLPHEIKFSLQQALMHVAGVHAYANLLGFD